MNKIVNLVQLDLVFFHVDLSLKSSQEKKNLPLKKLRKVKNFTKIRRIELNRFF